MKEPPCVNCAPDCPHPYYWSHVQEFKGRCCQCACLDYKTEEE